MAQSLTGLQASRLLGLQLRDRTTRTAAIRRIAAVFRRHGGNAVHSAADLGVSHRTLMGWVHEIPELRRALDESRR